MSVVSLGRAHRAYITAGYQVTCWTSANLDSSTAVNIEYALPDDRLHLQDVTFRVPLEYVALLIVTDCEHRTPNICYTSGKAPETSARQMALGPAMMVTFCGRSRMSLPENLQETSSLRVKAMAWTAFSLS
jgi:hypothetical protein